MDEPNLNTGDSAANPDIGNVAPVPKPPEQTAPAPVASAQSSTPVVNSNSHSSGSTDYTQLGVQILLVSLGFMGLYYFRYRTLQNNTAIAKMKSDYAALLAEKQALENDPATKNASFGI
jgi:hypothetical protein